MRVQLSASLHHVRNFLADGTDIARRILAPDAAAATAWALVQVLQNPAGLGGTRMGDSANALCSAINAPRER